MAGSSYRRGLGQGATKQEFVSLAGSSTKAICVKTEHIQKETVKGKEQSFHVSLLMYFSG